MASSACWRCNSWRSTPRGTSSTYHRRSIDPARERRWTLTADFFVGQLRRSRLLSCAVGRVAVARSGGQ